MCVNSDLISQYSKALLVKVTLFGSGYNYELESSVRQELSLTMSTITRGGRGPAAGPEVLVQIAVDFLMQIPSDIRVALVTAAVTKVLSAVESHTARPPVLGKLTIASEDFDVVVSVIDDPMLIENIDFDDLITSIREFACAEKKEGNLLNKVTLPCEVVERNGKQQLIKKRGSIWLWDVEYRDGSRWPFAVYDAANHSFIECADYAR